jgi:hypothetical protein
VFQHVPREMVPGPFESPVWPQKAAGLLIAAWPLMLMLHSLVWRSPTLHEINILDVCIGFAGHMN